MCASDGVIATEIIDGHLPLRRDALRSKVVIILKRQPPQVLIYLRRLPFCRKKSLYSFRYR